MIESFEIAEYAEKNNSQQILFLCVLKSGKRKIIKANRYWKDKPREEQVRMLENVINA